MQQTAQSLAPERAGNTRVTYKAGEGSEERRPGTMKVLVGIGSKLTRSQARQARKAGKDTVEVYVGTRDPIARLQEFGTRKAPPQPFMRPAWERHKDQALEDIKQNLATEIDKAAARAARKAARAAAGRR